MIQWVLFLQKNYFFKKYLSLYVGYIYLNLNLFVGVVKVKVRKNTMMLFLKNLKI